jgi:hypothetical protein
MGARTVINSDWSCVAFLGCVFDNLGSYDSSGGAISGLAGSSSSSDVSIHDCVFHSCHVARNQLEVTYGGAVYLGKAFYFGANCVSVIVTRSSFASSFFPDDGDTHGQGGAIVTNPPVIFSYGNFTECLLPSGAQHSSAMVCGSESSITYSMITGCSGGSALGIFGSVNSLIDHCVFYQNVCQVACIYKTGGSVIVVEYCHFLNNKYDGNDKTFSSLNQIAKYTVRYCNFDAGNLPGGIVAYFTDNGPNSFAVTDTEWSEICYLLPCVYALSHGSICCFQADSGLRRF